VTIILWIFVGLVTGYTLAFIFLLAWENNELLGGLLEWFTRKR
jgi:hypothetical protein